VSSIDRISTPSDSSAARMWRVSSLSSTPVSVLAPSASAASASARLVMLLDPGTRHVSVGGAISLSMVNGPDGIIAG
jgi:hypothetical protein